MTFRYLVSVDVPIGRPDDEKTIRADIARRLLETVQSLPIFGTVHVGSLHEGAPTPGPKPARGRLNRIPFFPLSPPLQVVLLLGWLLMFGVLACKLLIRLGS